MLVAAAWTLALAAIAAVLIAPMASAQDLNDRYYRFEEGVAGQGANGTGSIVDSIWNSPDGTPNGEPLYSADVPLPVIPQTGEPNALSLSFGGAQSVLFDSVFLLHRGLGDATLEFFQKGPNDANEDIFWTRPTTTPDANRFNVFNSSGQCVVDYREPGGALHECIPTPMGDNVWTHIAVVKDVTSAAPSHQYRIYVDGILRTTTEFPDTFIEPDPQQQWTISGRSGYRFTGLIDEVRLTHRALTPDEFLISPPLDAARVANFAVQTGTHIAGNAGRLRTSDNRFLKVESEFIQGGEPPYVMIVEVKLKTQEVDLTDLQILVEGKLSQNGGTSKLYLRNWAQGGWTRIATDPIGKTEMIQKVGGLDPDKYISASGVIKLRIKHTKTTSSNGDPFRSLIDHVQALVR